MVPAFMILLVCRTQATTQKSPELQSPYMSKISVHESESVLKHCTCILEAEPVLRGKDIQCMRKKWPRHQGSSTEIHSKYLVMMRVAYCDTFIDLEPVPWSTRDRASAPFMLLAFLTLCFKTNLNSTDMWFHSLYFIWLWTRTYIWGQQMKPYFATQNSLFSMNFIYLGRNTVIPMTVRRVLITIKVGSKNKELII